MKKRMIVMGTMLAAVCMLAGCKKTMWNEERTSDQGRICLPADPLQGTEPASYYSRLFLNDPAFAVVIDKFGNDAFTIVSTVQASGGNDALNSYNKIINTYSGYGEVEQFYSSYGIDKEAMLQLKANILASILYVYQQHPAFYNLTPEQQVMVIENVFTTLKDGAFRDANAVSPVVKAYNALAQRVGAQQCNSCKLTMDEVTDCLKGAVGGAIVGSIKVLRSLYNVITGYNLGWSGIVEVAKSALGTALKDTLVGALVGFGICVAWDAFD